MQQNCNSCTGYLTDWIRYPPESGAVFNGRVRWKAIHRNAAQLAKGIYNIIAKIPSQSQYIIRMKYNHAVAKERNKRNKSLFGMSLTHDDIRSINIFGNIYITEIIIEYLGKDDIDALKTILEDTSCIMKKGVVEEWLGFVILSNWESVQTIHNEHTTRISPEIEVPFQSFKGHRPSTQRRRSSLSIISSALGL